MSGIRKFNIDSRVFVPGKRNPYVNQASWYNFNDVIYHIVYGIPFQTPSGPLLIQNGMNSYNTPTNYIIELGGDLTTDTSINGLLGTYGISFSDLSQFNVSTSLLTFTTTGMSGSINGSFLQLQDNTTGEVEYSAFALPLTDGLNGQTLVTDGAGNVSWQNAITPTINVDNALEFVSGTLYWGGNLVQNTEVFGQNIYSVDFNDLNEFNVNSENSNIQVTDSLQLSSASSILISSIAQFILRTPDVNSSLSQIGSILQLKDNTTGDSDFTSYSFPLNTSNENEVLVLNNSNELEFNRPEVNLTVEISRYLEDLSVSRFAILPISSDLSGMVVKSFVISTFTSGGNPGSFDFTLLEDNASGVIYTGTISTGTTTVNLPVPYTLSGNERLVMRTDPQVGGTILGTTCIFRITNN